MAKQSAIEKKDSKAAALAPCEHTRPFEMEGAAELEKMVPRGVIHQGKMSKKFWGDHPEGTLINSVTGDVLPAPLTFVPIGINWMEFICYGENIGDPIVYRTRNKADVPPEDLQWHDKEPPVCETNYNFECLASGIDFPISVSMKGSSKHQKKVAGALYQFEKTRAGAKRGPGLYELSVGDASNDKGEWKIPVLRSLGNPPADVAKQAVDLWAEMRGQNIEVHIDDGNAEPGYDPNLDG